MKRPGLRLALALSLCAALLPLSALAEASGEIDLFSPEIYIGEVPDAPAAPPVDAPSDPQEPSPLGEASGNDGEELAPEDGRSDAVATGAGENDAADTDDAATDEKRDEAAQEPSLPEESTAHSEPEEVVPPEQPLAEAPPLALAPEPLPEALTLGVKETRALGGPATIGDQPVTYVSSKPKVAAVDASGLVTANRKGSATITRYVGDAPLDSCQVSVLKAPRKVQLPGKSLVLSAGEARPFAASLPSGCAGAIAYASDNPAILAVDASGNLFGVSGGAATLTATAYNGKSASCAVRVLGGPAPTWLTVEPATLQLPEKGTATLAARFDEGCDAILSFTSSNPKRVSVSDDGTVTTKKAGQATITVTTHNGLSASCEVLVYTAPKKVTLNARKLTLNVNDGYQLTATLTKNSVSEIAWTSDNPAVATVDASGLVAAVGAGSATVTATTTNGKRATCKVTVKGGESSAVDRHGDLVYQEESETLKVRIVNDRGIFLAYVWAKDPSRQLFKRYGNDAPYALLQGAVDGDAGLRDSIVLGFDASSAVNDKFHPTLDKDPVYHHREPSPLIIANGEVLSNDPDKEVPHIQLYWIDGDGRLRFAPKALEEMTAQERGALYGDIIGSGARNTITWYPALIEDHKALPVADWIQRRFNGKLRKQAFCQVDDHNFIIVSTNIKGGMTFPALQKYLLNLGVRTAVALDGGNSASMLVKPKGSTTVERVNGGSRRLSMVMYFAELD
ncbi:MAG: Ig-like domain-containing protein [Clostridia bacterium]|nr:Ig-like domain-containing protein [Clostridia bacterium]